MAQSRSRNRRYTAEEERAIENLRRDRPDLFTEKARRSGVPGLAGRIYDPNAQTIRPNRRRRGN